MKKTLALAALSLAFAASAASAQNLYVGGAIGVADSDIDCAGTITCDNSGTGGKVFAGYKFTDFIAVEVGYLNLGKAKATVDVGPIVDVDIKSSGFTVGAAGFLPFSNQFRGIGRVGVYANKTKVSGTVGGLGSATLDESSTTAYVGLGLGYAVTRQLSIDAGLDVTNIEFEGEQNNVMLYSIGLRYAF